jgi:hypothetical protein
VQPLSTLALTLEATARVLEKYQLDAASLFAAAGLDPEPYLNADARIPAAKLARIWDECERLTGNPCIGFKVGQHVTAGNLHAVGFGLLASRTLAEALRRLLRHQRLITTIGRSTLETHSVELQMVVDPGARAPQQGLDALMTAVVALTR